MFTLHNNSLRSIDTICGQFGSFSKSETKLPDLVVSFFNCKETNNVSFGKLLTTISGFEFRDNGGEFTITKAEPYRDVFVRFSPADCYESADIFCPQSCTQLNWQSVSDLLLNAYKYRAAACGATMIHSAAVVYDGCGVLFCGMPGAGKSTQAHLWEEYLGAKTINYDQPCIVNEGDRHYVCGTPWSGKERLHLNTYAPLKAIVFVEQAPYNEAKQLSAAEGFSLIYLNNYLYPLTKEIESAHLNNINSIARNIPVYRLKCTISSDAVKAMFNPIFGGGFDEARRRIKMKYKTKDCFELKEVAGDTLVISRGAASIDFSAVLILNETGTFLWKQMSEFTDKATLVQKLIDEYHVGIEIVAPDVDKCIEKMIDSGLLDTQE